VRTISAYTSGLVRETGREPTATFAAFMDLEPFLATAPTALPERPTALFVGVLERYKAVDVLAEAWRLVSSRVPGARLHLVGRGTLREVAERLAAALPEQVRWDESLSTPEVARALDDATFLVLPSRSEGLGRVVVEAFCRGRGVVGSRVGGIPDIVADGQTGLLVPPGDARALADALVRVLTDPALAERFGAAARAAVEPWLALRTGAPIVPVGISGSYERWPRGQKLPHPGGHVAVRVGSPFRLADELPADIDRRAAKGAATELIMRRIAELVPERQRSRYGTPAASRPEADPVG
jgi:glycosyltransferase involved in cell wall biosynthesis